MLFNLVEASIDDHKQALAAGHITSVELVVKYLLRIAKYDVREGFNAFTVMNPKVLEEAQASDERRASGLPVRQLEGIPYTLKDSYKYEGMTVTNGSPALEGLMSSDDSHMASRLRAAGAVLVGKTNMPPMAAGGMQRGLYARAESPYNKDYLTAAFSSGSSNGAGTSTAASFACFGLGSETVSSGRSPASNNALVAYTPSRGVLSCRGLWPLYVTCDVVVPYARSVKDMLEILPVLSEEDAQVAGDFWRDQPHVRIPPSRQINYHALAQAESLKGKRIGVPKMYIGEKDSDLEAKSTTVNPAVIALWQRARADLEALGAEIVTIDFPLVTNYENDSISKEANNVKGAPPWWNDFERGALIAKCWEDFLNANVDARISGLTDVDPNLVFPKPAGYVPDTFVEVKNLINYGRLADTAQQYQDIHVSELPGMKEALISLEAQRKRDFEDWLDKYGLDCVVFPANGDVGRSDLETNIESARDALQNGVKYSNGNRAIRHLGVPTVSVPMGTMADTNMPVNLTFAGKAYSDSELLQYAYAYEQKSRRRIPPPLTPALATDCVMKGSAPIGIQRPNLTASAMKMAQEQGKEKIRVSGTITPGQPTGSVEVYLDGNRAMGVQIDGNAWDVIANYEAHNSVRISCLLEPMKTPPVMVLVVARVENGPAIAQLLWL
jgi:Asp-tRNA(Asn)/Glu-tRNA(Gln) amidotransferase A subunit family amidase